MSELKPAGPIAPPDGTTFTAIDAAQCEVEPIRFSGAVQPHGALLVLEPQSRVIEAASESCAALLGRPAAGLLGLDLHRVFGAAADAALLAAQREGLGCIVPLALEGRELRVRVGVNESGQWLLDIEPAATDAARGRGMLYRLRRDLPGLRAISGVPLIAKGVATLVREVTGFDRVMVYRFDEAWNGEVIAEACVAGIEPYAGLHFPASDIPAQARQLFRQSRVRMISDVRYAPSALLARGEARAVDLGGSSLRSVSPIHIEYLTNMQVRATLVGSLVVEGQLWGLLSCQHKSGPRYFGPEERDALGWFCEDVAAHIEATLTRQRREREYDLSQRRMRLVEVIRSVHIKALMRHGAAADLLDVVSADGFALVADRSIQKTGQTPERSRIRALLGRRRECGSDATLYATSALKLDLGLEDVGDGVAGALFVSLRDRPGITLIWFRNERRYSVRWGGDPARSHTADESGRLSPRKSFEQFLQSVHGRCLPWTAEECNSAAELGALIEIEALREGEAFTQTILDSIPANIAVLDPQGVIVSVNEAWKRFAGANGAPELAALSVGTNYHSICEVASGRPDGAEAAPAWAGIEAVQNRALDSFTLDYPCNSPDERRWFRMSVFPLREPCEGTVVMHENITRSKLAEQRLDYERNQLRTLLETIPDLVWLKDPEGHYLTCNAQFEQLFGARQADIVGKTDYDFVPAAQADEFRRHDAAAAAAPRPLVSEEWLVYASDGHEALVETTKTAMRDARGTLIGVLGVARDITERHRMQQQVQQLALSDTLTGLANRRLLGDRVKHAVQASRRSGHTAALMFIDLDKFKALNDAHGHDVGDQVLIEVARRLKAGVREVDTVARFGGDEFVVLLGELDKDPAQAREQAGVLARKILAALALPYVLEVGRDGEKVGTIEHLCTASIGVGLHNGPDTNVDELFKRADLAMYQAKLAGRDVVRFFDPQDGPAR